MTRLFVRLFESEPASKRIHGELRFSRVTQMMPDQVRMILLAVEETVVMVIDVWDIAGMKDVILTVIQVYIQTVGAVVTVLSIVSPVPMGT